MIRNPMQLNSTRKELKKQQSLLKRVMKRLLFLSVNLPYRIKYEGLEHIPDKGPYVLVANHTHLADVIAIHSVIDHNWVAWVGKQEIFKVPLLGRFFLKLDGIPVNRDKADLATARGIIQALRQEKIVGMFPQGTRVRYEDLRKVRPRSGAAHFALKTDTPLLPVAVDGRFKLFHSVRIIFGPAFKLEKPADKVRADSVYLEEKSIEIMQRIFALAGQEYELDTDARKNIGARQEKTKHKE